VIHRTEDGPDGPTLFWELQLAPGGRVPSTHAHPIQEERFTIVEGEMKFRVGRRRMTVGAGQTVVVPPGTVHDFANPGPDPVRALVETRPPLDMVALLETAAAMAKQQRSRSRLLPNPLHLALFMRDFHREVKAPYLPTALVRLVTGFVAALARWSGLDARYSRLRAR
jgi:gentisate 1,2-dioxygenase